MPNSRSGPSRRTLLASTAVATAAEGGLPLLSACGGEGSRGQEGRVSEDSLRSIPPTCQASDAAVDPDIAVEHGSSPGCTRWIPQQELGVSVPEPRGGGGRINAMTPLWGTPPRAGNPFWTAMDEAIGLRMNGQVQDGNTYGEKLAATLAGSDIPDVVCIPNREFNGQTPQAIPSRFADLGPFHSGDSVLDHPNLAAIPTEAWQPSVFGGALRGLPMPANPNSGVLLHYRQDIFDANGWTQPGSAQEFYDFCVDITNARDRVWTIDDPTWFAQRTYGVLPDKPLYWKQENGRPVHRLETEEYIEAPEWTRTLYEAEVVHPDAVAATGDQTGRFAAGECLMYITGDGSWYGVAAEQRATDFDFRMNAMDFFAPDGGDPVLWRGNGATIWSFVNKTLSEDRVREVLELANFRAAPYGTVEQRLKQYGIEGTHYTVEDGAPIRTEQGNIEVVVPGRRGHVWLAGCSDKAEVATGLWRSKDGGATWKRISAIDLAIGVGFGKAAKPSGYPAICTSATVAGQDGIFRSTDGGSTWVRINDDAHQWAFAGSAITGDPHIFGRVHLSARGIVHGDIAG